MKKKLKNIVCAIVYVILAVAAVYFFEVGMWGCAVNVLCMIACVYLLQKES